jgi:hypothetical protein
MLTKLSEDEISQQDTNEITKALDYLPLAITQAAAYLDQNNIIIAKYLQLFRAGKADRSDLLKENIHDPGRDYESQNSVFQTWRISSDQISKQNPRAAEALYHRGIRISLAVCDRLTIFGVSNVNGGPRSSFTSNWDAALMSRCGSRQKRRRLKVPLNGQDVAQGEKRTIDRMNIIQLCVTQGPSTISLSLYSSEYLSRPYFIP